MLKLLYNRSIDTRFGIAYRSSIKHELKGGAVWDFSTVSGDKVVNGVLQAAARRGAGEPFTDAASMAKLYASEMVGFVTDAALQMHGGYGFTRELRYLTELTSPVTGTVLLEPLRRSWVASSEELNTLCEGSLAENPDGLAIAYFVDHRAADRKSTRLNSSH